MVAVDNAAATSVKELAEALQRTSNIAQMSGVSFNQLLGYVGTVSSVTRKSAMSCQF
jgi:TP901 family phage tail tape measure protein